MIGAADDRAALIADFAHERTLTRGLLERVPDRAFAWRPHARSMTLGTLASHLAELPHWGVQLLESDGYEVRDGHDGHRVRVSVSDVLAAFDRHYDDLVLALSRESDDRLAGSWVLRRGDRDITSVPRLTAVRLFILHHLVHHRGQLTVYLRLLDVPLPPLYGPTADEQP